MVLLNIKIVLLLLEIQKYLAGYMILTVFKSELLL